MSSAAPAMQSNSKALLQSKRCMATISQFLGIKDVLRLNLVNKFFYNDVVPKIFEFRQLYSSLTPETYLIQKNNIVHQLHYNNSVPTRLIEFEEDEYRHDFLHIVTDQDCKATELFKID